MTTTTRRWNPRLADQHRKDAGTAYRRTGSMQKHTARSLGLDASQMSRRANGHIGSPAASFYDEVYTLAADHKTSPGGLIAGAMMAAVSGLSTWSMDELVRGALEAARAETVAECAENLSEHELIRALESGNEQRMGEACAAYDERCMDEIATEVDLLMYVRALLVRLGLRVAPEGV